MRIPVYVLVTKSDLLAGFSEFFAPSARRSGRRPGASRCRYGKEQLDPAAMTAELQRLEKRLYDRLPERLEEERDPARRALLYGFPQQFTLLRDRLVHFIDAAFAPTRFESAAHPARRLFHERHPGRQSDRPGDGRSRAGPGPRAPAPARPEPDGPELLPDPSPARGRVPRSRACRVRSALGAPPAVDPDRRHRGVRGRAHPRHPGVVAQRPPTTVATSRGAGEARRDSEAGDRRPRRCPERPDRALADADGRARTRRDRRHRGRLRALVMALRPLPGRQARGREPSRLSANAPGHFPALACRRTSSATSFGVGGQHGRVVRRAEDLPHALRSEASRYRGRSGAGIRREATSFSAPTPDPRP